LSKKEKRSRRQTKIDLKRAIRARLPAFEELEKSWAQCCETTFRKIEFKKGIILGLTLGIIGNLAVQFFYSVYERVFLRNFDKIFWTSLLGFIICLAITFHIIFRYRRQLREDYRKMDIAVIEEIRFRQLITDLKTLLEYD